MRRHLAGPLGSLVLFGLTALTTAAAYGPAYAAALLAILAAHEMGHFLQCRRHGVDSTWPLFLPVPFGFGTFGALIKIRSLIPSRRALLDIGAAGPLAGLAVALPVTVLGIGLSAWAPDDGAEWLTLGQCLGFRLLALLVHGPRPEGTFLALHPVGLAGWLGLLVTGLNLLPVGQLDGGHVVYALAGDRVARRITSLALAGFAALTLFVYNYWVLFLLLAGLIARRHPPTVDDLTPLDPARQVVAWSAIAFFFLTFVPTPVRGIPQLLDFFAQWAAAR